MMLKKEFRGKEFGISKILLETVIKWCEENRISKLYLGTMKQFKTAQSFYKGHHNYQNVNQYIVALNKISNYTFQ